MLYHTDEDQEFHIEEDCYIVEIMNQQDNPDLSISRARVLPNIKTKLHSLNNTTEYYQIISGQGIAYIGLKSYKVSQGDLIKIEPNMSQSIQNIGNEDLIFLCICQPRFEASNYIDLES